MSFDPADAITFYLVFLYSTVLHEAAHAWAALKLGDDTAYQGGQVSLDPIPHIRRSVIGMVVVPILTLVLSGGRSLMGWASAPFNPDWARRNPRSAGLMSVAGPASNVLLLLGAALVMRVGLQVGVFQAPNQLSWGQVVIASDPGGVAAFVAFFASVVFSQNLLLAAFNLLPLPPFDGASVPLIFLRDHAAEVFFDLIHNQAFMWIGLIIAFRTFGGIWPHIQIFVVNLFYAGIASFA